MSRVQSPGTEVVPLDPSLRIPPILLEGDEPARPPLAGPGEKYTLGPTAPSGQRDSPEHELPTAYGTGRLFLTARDPHCLYACWDLTAEQQRLCNSLSKHHHLVVRVHQGTVSGQPVNEIHVHPESRHWFIHVEHAGRTYVAELGYTQANGQFRTTAVSDPVTTPTGTVAEERAVELASITFETADRSIAVPTRDAPPAPLGFSKPQPSSPSPTRGAGFQSRGPASAEVLPEREPNLAEPPPHSVLDWTPEQEQALAEIIGSTLLERQSPCSAEIAALLLGAGQRPGAAPEAIQFALPMPLGPEVSSPPGGEFPEQQGFWFNVNAELIIYGATEPGALVTIGGSPIRLRPDGSFSCRFALPDGYYHLPLSAVSAQGDARHAKLEFYRGTRYGGEVGAHPQDPALKTPHAENVD
ncbi:MAG TPA: DUF4912 domain-containing protein [Candidatus Acidoferrum sp.]|nr:DUF4912 domain-containing protein [Candidatus Acidoferrum sp.]